MEAMNQCNVEIGIDAGERPEDYRCCLEDGHASDHVIQADVVICKKGSDDFVAGVATIIVRSK